jgi:hypothetical protein
MRLETHVKLMKVSPWLWVFIWIPLVLIIIIFTHLSTGIGLTFLILCMMIILTMLCFIRRRHEICCPVPGCNGFMTMTKDETSYFTTQLQYECNKCRKIYAYEIFHLPYGRAH